MINVFDMNHEQQNEVFTFHMNHEDYDLEYNGVFTKLQAAVFEAKSLSKQSTDFSDFRDSDFCDFGVFCRFSSTHTHFLSQCQTTSI